MIDVHCHLNFHAYENDYDEQIKEAHEEGVEIIINVGTKLDSSEKAVALAQQYKNLYAIVGVHPHHADKLELNKEAKQMNPNGVADQEGIPMARSSLDEVAERAPAGGKGLTGPQINEIASLQAPRNDENNWLKELEKLARKPKVVAIGEIGMDYFSYKSNGIVDPKLQREIFEQQIDLAYRVGLPIQIHNRHAGKDMLEILYHHKNILKSDFPGMFHCFAGDMDVLRGALDLGFMIGFDGNITYPGLAPKETVSLSELAKATPLDRIVTETDSPFLTPVPFRGTRNTPSRVILVGEFLSQLKGVSFQTLNEITTTNAKKLFSI